MSNNKDECCTPKGQVPRSVDCVGCDKKPIEIMEKKLSSVDWLEWQINLGLSERGLISAFKEAKQMHKEEIIDAYIEGHSIYGENTNAEKYYNETFNNENTDTTT